GGRLGAELDAVLDDLAPGDTEIVALQVGAPESRGLLNGGAHDCLLGVGAVEVQGRATGPRSRPCESPVSALPGRWPDQGIRRRRRTCPGATLRPSDTEGGER